MSVHVAPGVNCGATLGFGISWPRSSAIFGTSVFIHGLAALLYKAAKFLSGQSAVHEFFRSEAAARAWLDQERLRLLAAKASA